MLNVLSICVTVLVLNLHHRESVTHVPKWLERLLGSRWRSLLQKKGTKVDVLTLIKTEDVNPDDEAESSLSETRNDNEMKKARDTAKKQVKEEETLSLKWRDVAEAVNAVLCAVYIFAGVIASTACFVPWYQG